eukprot:TRINITY_DN25720_c0_g1_i1.p1 TRINITY_DN25720_c0_g1~~TRINITY_DN25720_c0_g1_i1.p1  ORF type:complete len:503 (+),score=72.13 TRINITY_DN25720_c0_g1_i1:201-1511(+)
MSKDDLLIHLSIGAWAQRLFQEEAKLSRSQATPPIQTPREGLGSEVARLGRLANMRPEMDLGVAMALYNFLWWDTSQEDSLNVGAVENAADGLRRSIAYSGCDSPLMPLPEFSARQCQLRWRHLLMIADELATHSVRAHAGVGGRPGPGVSDDASNKRIASREGSLRKMEAARMAREANNLPWFNRYEELGGRPLERPCDANFNQDFFPHVAWGPLWPRPVVLESVPIAAFLEAHHAEFAAELRRLLLPCEHLPLSQCTNSSHTPGSFSALHLINGDAGSHYREFTQNDGGWESVYFVRAGRWNSVACRAAPRSCDILQSRPEFGLPGCALGNTGAGFLRLAPGARLKPHFGVAPRLSVHLGLLVPRVGKIQMTVGGQQIVWREGRAVVFDDTFAHSASHEGVEPRFILNAWICHPCDTDGPRPGFCDLPPGWVQS